MRRAGEPVVQHDPMAAAAAMMNLWRVTMFDLPFAWALHVNECAKRWSAHQSALAAQLAEARDVDEVAAVQAEMVGAVIEDYEESAASLARDVAVTLKTAQAG